jgi:hypothetical protein
MTRDERGLERQRVDHRRVHRGGRAGVQHRQRVVEGAAGLSRLGIAVLRIETSHVVPPPGVGVAVGVLLVGVGVGVAVAAVGVGVAVAVPDGSPSEWPSPSSSPTGCAWALPGQLAVLWPFWVRVGFG